MLFSTIVTMVYISSLELIHHITESLYPLPTPLTFPYLHVPAPGNYFSILFLLLWVWLFFACFVYITHVSETMQYLSFFIWLSSLSIMSSVVLSCCHMTRFPFKRWLVFHCVGLKFWYICITFSFPFVSWRTLRLFLYFGYCNVSIFRLLQVTLQW